MEATLTLFSWCFLTMKFSLGSVFGCQLPGINILPTSSSWQIIIWIFKSSPGISGFKSIFKLLHLVKEIKYLTNKQSFC